MEEVPLLAKSLVEFRVHHFGLGTGSSSIPTQICRCSARWQRKNLGVMVTKARVDAIKTQKADFESSLTALDELAGENREEMRTHASRNFWNSLSSLFVCQVLKKLWYMLLPSFLQHMSHLFTYSFLEGEGKKPDHPPRKPLSANGLSGGFAADSPGTSSAAPQRGIIV